MNKLVDASEEILSLADVKAHLRITSCDDDDALRAYISSARNYIETYISKTLINTTYQIKLDDFKNSIFLEMEPINTVAIEYIDTDGNTQPFVDFYFDENGRVAPVSVYPPTKNIFGAVTITYNAGLDNAGLVPDSIKQAMKLIVGSWDINREDVIIGTTAAKIPNDSLLLLNQHRKWSV